MSRKRCPSCWNAKPVAEFVTKGGHVRSYCRACHAQNTRESGERRGGREYYRAKNIRYRYGLSAQEYDRMLEKQGGVCAVCGGPPLGKGRYHVDHDHVTGHVRGLLCHKCNVALGLVGDDVAQLAKLTEYLTSFEAKRR